MFLTLIDEFGADMITNPPSSVTYLRPRRRAFQHRIASTHDLSPKEERGGSAPSNHSPSTMGVFQGLSCGVIGLSLLAGLMRAIDLGVSLLAQECNTASVYDFLQIFGL